jgi:hypothetical protein
MRPILTSEVVRQEIEGAREIYPSIQLIEGLTPRNGTHGLVKVRWLAGQDWARGEKSGAGRNPRASKEYAGTKPNPSGPSPFLAFN